MPKWSALLVSRFQDSVGSTIRGGGSAVRESGQGARSSRPMRS